MIIDIGCNILLDFRTDPECLFVIDSQNDIQLIILQKRRDCLSRRQQRQVFGKTVNPGCEQRKDNAFTAQSDCFLQTGKITAFQYRRFLMSAILPDRTDSEKHILCLKTKPGSHPEGSGRDFSDPLSCGKKFIHPGFPVNCGFRSPAAYGVRIGRTYNGRCLHFRDICSD